MIQGGAARTVTIATHADARALEAQIRAAAADACRALVHLLSDDQPLDVFRAMKFRRVGYDPLDAERPLNLLEQVHQTFAWLTAVRGAEALLRRHPDHAPFRIAIGVPGPDIVSADGAVAAEVFAAISPVNNNKLKSDVDRMRAHAARFRYVFYYAEEDRGAVSDPAVEVIAVEL